MYSNKNYLMFSIILLRREKAPSFSDLKHDMSEGQHQLDFVDPSAMYHAPMPLMVPVQYEPGNSCTYACR